MAVEPSTLTIHDNPAREFRVANESQIIAVIEIEYRGGGWWRGWLDADEHKDNQTYASRSLSDVQKWAVGAMQWQETKAAGECVKICGTDGEDTSGHGNFACGVMSPHGISIQVLDADGDDLTQDYLINGV